MSQFHQHSTYSFCTSKSQKRKKYSWVISVFLGSAGAKAVHRMLIKLSPGRWISTVQFWSSTIVNLSLYSFTRSSKMIKWIVKLHCDSHFQRAFTSCTFVFKVITLIGSNQGNCFENATTNSKRRLKTTVTTQLFAYILPRALLGCPNQS